MRTRRISGRQLKADILSLLQQDDFNQALATIEQLPARQAVNPLFSFFYHVDEKIRWRAIVAMGVVVAHLSATDLESARVVMRRLMWNLNDESGGIGWGSPEAMGEILARSPILAEEFSHILVSYLCEEMNFLEHEGLQRGLLWGLSRLAEKNPERVQSAGSSLVPFFMSPDPTLRGLAGKAATAIGGDSAKQARKSLSNDQAIVRTFIHSRFLETTVAGLLSLPSDDFR